MMVGGGQVHAPYGDIAVAVRLLESVCRILEGTGIHVQIFDVPPDLLAQMLLKGAGLDRLGDETQVAALEERDVKLTVFGKSPRALEREARR